MFDLEKSQFLREALEQALLSRALERGDRATLLRQLRTEIAVQQAFVEAGDAARFYASDEQFHASIAEQAGMPTVLPEMARAKTHMDRFRHLMLSGHESLPTVLAQHQAIVDAIVADDRPRASAAMQSHLRRILAFVDIARAAHPDFFEMEEEPARAATLGARGTNAGNSTPIAQPRVIARIACLQTNGRFWRNLRHQPKTAFSRLLPVRRTNREGRLRVEGGPLSSEQDRLIRAESALSDVTSERTGVRTKAAIPLRARNRLRRTFAHQAGMWLR